MLDDIHVLVKVKLREGLGPEYLPARATEFSAGSDLRAAFSEREISIAPGERAAVPTGIFLEITRPGVAGFIFSRSGLGARDGLTVSQGVGVIDNDYRGEVVVWLLNTSQEVRTVKQGERIAQIVFLPAFAADFVIARSLAASGREEGGFGHSGKM